MENYEIVNEEVEVAETEEVEESNFNGYVAIAIVGLATLGAGLLYKKVIKPAIAKHKAKKEEEKLIEVKPSNVRDEDEDIDDSTEE